jgi:glutathione S-transferase
VITLFHKPKTRSSRFIFLLEELEAPYEIKLVTIRQRENLGAADPANPHPHGKVPAIADDGAIVFESPAIALYLTDRFPDKHLGPMVGEPGRADYVSWLCYYASVLEPAFVSKFMKMEVPRGTAGWVAVDEAMPTLIKRLSQRPFMLGDEFSSVDVLYGTTFAMFAGSPLMSPSTVIEQYVQRVVSRPAFARAQAKEDALVAEAAQGSPPPA